MVPFSSIIFTWSIFLVAYAQLIVSHILGGEPAAIENCPYLISLQKNGQPICGGGIIGRRFILTAGHCIINEERLNSEFYVVAGTTDLENSTKDLSVKVVAVYILESFRLINMADDIAVLKLEKDLDLRRGLRILKLPTNNQSYAGQVAKVAGYGWHGEKDAPFGMSDEIVKSLTVTIISNSECRWQYRKFMNTSTTYQIHDWVICGQALPQRAGNPAGVCRGDSGSPLVIGNTVIGVASQASPYLCGNAKFAARYTRVSRFLGFVNNVLTGNITDDIGVLKLRNLTADAADSDEIYYWG